MSWGTVRKKEKKELLSFICSNEDIYVSLSSRLKQKDKDNFLFINRSRENDKAKACILGVLMLTHYGLILPAFGKECHISDSDLTLIHLLKGFSKKIYSVMGIGRDVLHVENKIGLFPKVSIEYSLMTLNKVSFSYEKLTPLKRFSIRTAQLSDFDAIYPLQKAYEMEEVVIDPLLFKDATCRYFLKKALKSEIILLAELNGKIVGKACTNARGYCTDQIGGVFTVPAARNQGVAYRIMIELLRRIFREKEIASLFVKRSNLIAHRLYCKLGFDVREDYRIDYLNF